MSASKRYYWIKLKDTFMNSDTVDYLMGLPNGANYVVLYQMLCLKTINTNGRLSRQIGEVIIPYDIEKITRDCKWFSADTVRVALNLYKAFGLIYEDKDGTLVLTDHDNLVGSETGDAARMRAIRAQQAQCLPSPDEKAEKEARTMFAQCSHNVTQDIRDKDIRNEILDKDNRDINCNKYDNIPYRDEKNISVDRESSKVKTDKRFSPPTVEEIRAYCEERKNGVDAELFYNFYASKGWKVGNQPMKDWRAVVRTWERRIYKDTEKEREGSTFDVNEFITAAINKTFEKKGDAKQ